MEWSNPFRKVVQNNKKIRQNGSGKTENKPVVEMIRGSLAAAHYLAPTARYALGPEKAKTSELKEGGDGEGSPEEIQIVSKEDRKNFRTRRQQFRAEVSQNGTWKSSKMKIAVERVKLHLGKKTGKVLVFSYSIAVLDILHAGLTDSGITVIRYDSTILPAERAKLERMFQDESPDSDSPKVMLVQSAAGGEGCTFTAANYFLFPTLEWLPPKRSNVHHEPIELDKYDRSTSSV